jgi:hypothetical protein
VQCAGVATVWPQGSFRESTLVLGRGHFGAGLKSGQQNQGVLGVLASSKAFASGLPFSANRTVPYKENSTCALALFFSRGSCTHLTQCFPSLSLPIPPHVSQVTASASDTEAQTTSPGCAFFYILTGRLRPTICHKYLQFFGNCI